MAVGGAGISFCLHRRATAIVENEVVCLSSRLPRNSPHTSSQCATRRPFCRRRYEILSFAASQEGHRVSIDISTAAQWRYCNRLVYCRRSTRRSWWRATVFPSYHRAPPTERERDIVTRTRPGVVSLSQPSSSSAAAQ